ncbi:MAG: tetratricopeptide repeat protein [Deltaproteobacteria bacterium]|nr:tetratricopeptide repeat protein [Deltaproteobacteria bacterium]
MGDDQMSNRSFYIEDLFPRLVKKIRDFLGKQPKFIVYTIYTICGILAVLAVYAGWHLYDRNYEKKAWELYANIQQNLAANPNTQLQDIAQGLQGIVNEYPLSEAANSANYRLGSIYYFSNNVDAAISSYKAYIRRASNKDELTTMAYISLGYANEAKGEVEKALDSYQKAEKTPNGANFSSTNWQNIARMYELQNKREKALEYYGKALKEIQDPVARRIVQSKIASL